MKSSYYVPPHKRGAANNNTFPPQNGNEQATSGEGNHLDQTQGIESGNHSYKTVATRSNLNIVKASSGSQNKHQGSKPAYGKKSDPNKTNLKYTDHAKLRAQQRDISKEDVKQTLREGEKADHEKGVSSYRDEDTFVVVGKGQHVVTVMENKRNTQYDLSRQTNTREKALIRKAKNPNNDHAMCELAEFYLNGSLGTKDAKKAYEWFLKAATKKNNSHAMCKISQLYESGELGEKNPLLALEWMEKAANFGNRYALAVSGQRLLGEYQILCTLPEASEQEKTDVRKKAMDFLHRSANKGATRAIWQLGQVYEEGLLGEKNLSKAIGFYKKAAGLGSPTSFISLQNLVSKGEFSPDEFEVILDKASQLIAKTSSQLAIDIGLQQISGELGNNPQRGLKMIEQAARKGNAEALYVLIKCYRDGCKASEPNHERAEYWIFQLKQLYEKAAGEGNLEAMWGLGKLFFKGDLGRIDLEQAEQFFIRTAEAGEAEDAYALGMLYIEGRLGNRDPSEGVAWITKAISLWTMAGNSDVAFSLGEVYLEGSLGTKDYSKALEWLFIAAKGGSIDAMLRLIELHLKQKSGCDIDKTTAIFIAQRLVTTLKTEQIEHAKDALLLGKLHREGKLIEKNLMEAVKWYYLAAAYEMNGEFEALLHLRDWSSEEKIKIIESVINLTEEYKDPSHMRFISRILGDVYNDGILIERNLTEAIVWYKKAAKLDNSKAMYKLGNFYETGTLGDVDLVKAIEWYIKSAKSNNQDAVKRLTYLSDLNDLDSELQDSIALWKTESLSKPVKSDSSKDTKVMYELGRKYRDGEDKEQDYLQAAYWFRKAAKHDSPEAALDLARMYEEGALGEKTCAVATRCYKQALKCYKLILERQQNNEGNSQEIVHAFEKIAAIYSKLGKPEKGLIYQERALQLLPQPDVDALDMSTLVLGGEMNPQEDSTLLVGQSLV